VLAALLRLPQRPAWGQARKSPQDLRAEPLAASALECSAHRDRLRRMFKLAAKPASAF
jgi:hypothetical protein